MLFSYLKSAAWRRRILITIHSSREQLKMSNPKYLDSHIQNKSKSKQFYSWCKHKQYCDSKEREYSIIIWIHMYYYEVLGSDCVVAHDEVKMCSLSYSSIVYKIHNCIHCFIRNGTVLCAFNYKYMMCIRLCRNVDTTHFLNQALTRLNWANRPTMCLDYERAIMLLSTILYFFFLKSDLTK